MTKIDCRLPRAKRSLGQNFLVDKNFACKIIDAANASDEDVIIEIGPGRGALTEELLKAAGRVIAVELDSELVPLLNERFGADDRFTLVAADALSLDFREFADQSKTKLKLVANLPYYISTAILTRLIFQRHFFSKMLLMFQKEVVERITAPPATSDRGYLTVMTEAFVTAERLFDVPPTAFRPVPKVWSSVVRLKPRGETPFDGREAEFADLVSAAFMQKRKTMQNNLRRAAGSLGIADVGEYLKRADIEPTRRAETLTMDEWSRMFLALRG